MYLCIFILRICARRRRSLNEAFLVKIANIIIVISCPRCVDSVGICIKCNSYIEFSVSR